MKKPVLVSFALWTLAGISASVVVLGASATPIEPVTHLAEVESAPYSQADFVALFDGRGLNLPANSTGAAGVKLLGVMFSSSGESMALIAIGSAPPKAYRTGALTPSGMKIASISKREIEFVSGSGELTKLSLPPQ